MKVCLVTEKYPPLRSGIGDYTFNLSKKLSDTVDVSVVTSNHVQSSVDIYPILSSNLFTSLKQTISIIRERDCDIIHFQSPESRKGLYILIFPIIFRLIFRKKHIVTTLHEYSDISLFWRMGMLPAIFFSHHLIVVDGEYISDIRRILPLNSEKFSFIVNGHNIAQPVIQEETNVIRYQLSSSENEILMGFFGFVYPGKGIENVLYVLSDILNSGELKTKFIIIGGISDVNPEYSNEIRALISSLGISNYVHITGYLDDATAINYLAAMDYFVFPFARGYSLRNASTLAVISVDKPFITTKRRGKKTLVADGILYIDSSEDRDSLKKLVLAYQNNERELFNTNYAALDFSWKRVADEHLMVYGNVRDK